MKASDFIADTLEQKGVSVVFEMIGGMITHIIDSLHMPEEISQKKHISPSRNITKRHMLE